MNAENYIVMQGWMIAELGLSGKELVLYALIYGYSQGDGGGFCGGIKYMAEWLGSTKRTVMTTLTTLESKGFITKFEEPRNGIKFCRYVANFTSGEKISPGGEKISPKKEKNNKDSFQKENTLTSVEEKVSLAIPEQLAGPIEAFKEMRNKIKKPMTDYAVKLLLKNLEKMAPGDIDQQIEILNQSIFSGYQGVFPLKEEKQKQLQQPKRDKSEDAMAEWLARRKEQGYE